MSGGRTGLESRAQRTGESMGLIAHVDGAAEGYEEVALPLFHDEPQAAPGRSPAVLRRRSARPTKRAVIYLHCMKDAFVPADLAGWYTERGFQFYVADLRTPRGPAPDSGPVSPAEYFACVDAAVQHVRDADGIETVVLCAHGSGALIAALWCHARRGGLPADALVLTSPEFGRRLVAGPQGARRRVRQAGAPPGAAAGRCAASAAAWPGHRLPGAGDVPVG